MPRRPPTPRRVKPRPSWMAVNSAEITITNEKPGLPSGICVSMTPKAFTATL